MAGVGIELPGPVEHATGRPTNPPIMPGWDGFDVPAFINTELDCIVDVDNDVNVMALGEHFIGFRDVDHLLFVKVATEDRQRDHQRRGLRRWSPPAASAASTCLHDVGAVCRCGNVGCRGRRQRGRGGEPVAEPPGSTPAPADVAALVRAGNVLAMQLVREAGRLIGEVLASAVSLLQPERDRDRRVAVGRWRPCSPVSARWSTASRCRWPQRLRIVRHPPATCPASSASR